MNHRRVIGSILALSLITGSAFVPLARAACAVPRANAPACPSCADQPASAAASVTMDRSCCAAPASLGERDPATVASVRSGDDHVIAATVPVFTPSAWIVSTPPRSPRVTPAPPGASPPPLRTTLLLI